MNKEIINDFISELADEIFFNNAGHSEKDLLTLNFISDYLIEKYSYLFDWKEKEKYERNKKKISCKM